jgi:gamma-glutamylcyclotransferase
VSWLYYLAFGSNLHPGRLGERVASALEIGSLPLSGFRLAFHKHGQDSSGKCNLVFTGHEQDVVHAALFRMQASDKLVLDRIEGKGRGYSEKQLAVSHDGVSHQCFTYTAQPDYIDDGLSPFSWYRELVLLGGEYHRFPENYLEAIRQLKAIDDPDPERRKEHDLLINSLRDANREMKYKR